MEQVNRRVHRDEATWRGIFARQAASGLLVSEFCRQEKINPGVFRRWRAALQGTQPARKVRPRSVDAKPTPAFVDLGALNHSGSRCEIRLELGGGVVLHMVRG